MLDCRGSKVFIAQINYLIHSFIQSYTIVFHLTEIQWITGPTGKLRHPSPQQHSLAHSGTSLGIFKLENINIPFSIFLICPWGLIRVLFPENLQRVVPRTPHPPQLD
ncbi:hypothetical protein GOODEAATRI_021509 [Goodea atripinnis]|uniref:Uncharacterized protein n=1 Tax=Goodea atripinnis TaxID=208336 RepID=A0ABV0N3C4_9TELE